MIKLIVKTYKTISMNWMIKIILLLENIINSQILFEICLFIFDFR